MKEKDINKNYDNLDVLKFILSIMIVAIHTNFFPKILYPWLRLAIPLFFMISSYLLNERIKKSDDIDRKSIIKKYIIRQIKLYFFWFIVLFPITIYIRIDWFSNSLFNSIKNVVTNFLFSSTFVASWFISASIIGTIIVYQLSKKISNIYLFFILIIPYILCCVISSYMNYCQDIYLFNKIYNIYITFFTSPVFSFPVALLPILLGKIISDYGITRTFKKIYCFYLIICLAMLYAEWLFVYNNTGMYINDCYFMLLPCCYYIFLIIIKLNIKCKYSIILRRVSTIIYPLHASLAFLIKLVLNRFDFSENIYGIICFVVTLCICFFVCYIIIKLQKNKKMSWLKYAY